MWYFLFCIIGVEATTCTAPQLMPSLEVCQTVGVEANKIRLRGLKHAVCINGQTGQSVTIE